MALNLTIAGVSQTATRRVRAGSISIDDPISERSTASFEIMSENGGYQPPLGADVLIYDGAVVAFGGELLSAKEQPFGNNIKLLTQVECVGYDVFTDRVLVTETIAAGASLFSILTTLVTYLAAAPYNVTLHPSQEFPGPTLVSGFTWDHQPLSECLAALVEQTGYLRKMNSSRQLRMWAPGSLTPPAPWDTDVTDAHTHCLSLSITRTREDYINRCYVRYGSGVVVRPQPWTADGAQTTFTVEVPPVPGGWYAGYADINGIHVPIGVTGIDALPWNWDPATGILETLAEWPGTGCGYPPAAGTTVLLTYTAQYPATVMAEATGSPSDIATYGLREGVIEKPEVFDPVEALAVAQQVIVAQDPDRLTLDLETRDTGLASGQTLSVIIALRGINASFLLTTVQATVDDDGVFRYTAEGESGETYRGSYLQTYRDWSLLGGGGTPPAAPASINTRINPGPVWLGGSRDANEGVVCDTWQPVRDYQEFWLYGEDWPIARVRVVMAAAAGGHTIMARWYNLTTAAVVAASGLVIGASWVETEFPVTLAAGWNKYRLEIQGSDADPCWAMGLLEPLPVTGAIAVSATWVVPAASASLGAPPVLCSVAGLTSRWNDDFSDGDALAVHYESVTNAESNATCGVGGGWGCRTTGTASQQYYGGFVKDVGSQTGSKFGVELTVDHNAHAGASYGSSLFELRDAVFGWFISLYQGADENYNDDDTAVVLSYTNPEGPGDLIAGDATGVLTLHTFQTIRLTGEFSTWTGSTINADGWMDVCVDGVRVIHATGLKLASPDGESSEGDNEWSKVYVGPMGNGDDLHIWSN